MTPTGLTPRRLAEVLSKVSGSPVTAESIESDIASGAPINPDGTLNLIRYAAWLLKNERPDRN